MAIAIYPGSFDPFTLGHLDVLTKASLLFERIIVAIFTNSDKKYMFSELERLKMIQAATKDMNNVEVIIEKGLLYEYVRKQKIDVVIRGVRNTGDCISEMNFYHANILLYDKINMVLIPSKPQTQGISSSVVKEILSFGGEINQFVPHEVYSIIKTGGMKR